MTRSGLFGDVLCEISVDDAPRRQGEVLAWALAVATDGKRNPVYDANGDMIFGYFRTADEALENIKQRLVRRYGPEQLL